MAQEWLRSQNMLVPKPFTTNVGTLMSFNLKVFPSMLTTLSGTVTRVQTCCFASSPSPTRAGGARVPTSRLLKRSAPGRDLGPRSIGGELLKSGAHKPFGSSARLSCVRSLKSVRFFNGRAVSCLSLSRKATIFILVREITCISPLLKIFTRPLRNHVVPFLWSLAGPSQFGGDVSPLPWMQQVCRSSHVAPSLLT